MDLSLIYAQGHQKVQLLFCHQSFCKYRYMLPLLFWPFGCLIQVIRRILRT